MAPVSESLVNISLPKIPVFFRRSFGARVMRPCGGGTSIDGVVTAATTAVATAAAAATSGGHVTVARDFDFLAEAGLLPRAQAARMLRRQEAVRQRAAPTAAGGGGGGNDGGDGGSTLVIDAGADTGGEPVTLYSFNGGGGATTGGVAFVGRTGGGPKQRPMDRSDRFTKLVGDVNHAPDGAA